MRKIIKLRLRNLDIKEKVNHLQNNECWLCGERNEMLNRLIRDSSQLAQKEYKTKYNWVGKVINWEF